MCFWSIGQVPPTYPCLLCILTSFFVSPPQKKERFPLLKLPYLPIQLVIKQMKIEDIIKLSVCSKKVGRLVKTGKYIVDGFHVHVKQEMHQFEINRRKLDYCDINFNRIGGWMDEKIDVKRMDRWFEKQNDYVMTFKPTNSIEDIFEMSNWIRTQFRVNYFTFKFFIGGVENVKSLLSSYRLNDGCIVFIFEGTIDKEALDYLLETMSIKVELHITSEIPLDFENKKAFRFEWSEYEEGRWVKIEDLKSLRNVNVLTLGRTNFSNTDIHSLLKYWSDECDEPMFNRLTITLREDVEIDQDVILEGFVTLQATAAKHSTCFFLAKNKNKKDAVAEVVSEDKKVTITLRKESWTQPILVLLNRKESLRSKFREVSRMENMSEEEWQQDEHTDKTTTFDNFIRKLRDEKVSIEKEFYEIVQKLIDLKARNFVDELIPF